jgi:hypothetical protein
MYVSNKQRINVLSLKRKNGQNYPKGNCNFNCVWMNKVHFLYIQFIFFVNLITNSEITLRKLNYIIQYKHWDKIFIRPYTSLRKTFLK